MSATARTAASVIGLVVLLGCTNATEPAASTTPTFPLSRIALTCKLPVAAPNAPFDGLSSDGTVGTGGFIAFPSGKFTRDPSSLGTYDSVVGKWLPVPRAWVSPDGLRYAFVVNRPDPYLHLVDAATGSDSVTQISAAWHVATSARLNISPMQVLAFEKDGVFLERIHPNSDAAPYGLALYNPADGTFQDPVAGAADISTYLAVREGHSFLAAETTGADSIPPDGSPPYFNMLMMWAVNGDHPEEHESTGQFYLKDSWVRLVGFDGGDQAIASATSASAYRILTNLFSSQMPFTVFAGKPREASDPTGLAVGDGPAVWFPSASGVVWYYPGKGEPFAAAAVTPFRSPVLAGPCI